MTEAIKEETPERKGRKKIAILIIIVLLLDALIAVIFIAYLINQQNAERNQANIKGKIEEIDDFYHAENGTWKMETTIHLLKSQKYVSSDTELKEYLVYTAKPGEIVRISQAAGRWKKLEVLKDGKITATGWADAEDGRAELQTENKPDK